MQHRSFTQFRQARELVDFDTKIDQLCESVVFSGLDFNTYWEQRMLPALYRSNTFVNENELLREMGWSMFNPRNWGGRGLTLPSTQAAGASDAFAAAVDPQAAAPQAAAPQAAAPQAAAPQAAAPQAAAPQAAAPQAAPADPAREKQRQQRLEKMQQDVQQFTQNIRKRLGLAMEDFLRGVTEDAKSKDNPYMWRLARMIYDRLKQSAVPVLNHFEKNIRAKYVQQTPDWMQAYQKERAAMQQNSAPPGGGSALNQLQPMEPPGTAGGTSMNTPGSPPVIDRMKGYAPARQKMPKFMNADQPGMRPARRSSTPDLSQGMWANAGGGQVPTYQPLQPGYDLNAALQGRSAKLPEPGATQANAANPNMNQGMWANAGEEQAPTYQPLKHGYDLNAALQGRSAKLPEPGATQASTTTAPVRRQLRKVAPLNLNQGMWAGQ